MTLTLTSIYKLDIHIPKMYLHTADEVFRSRLSEAFSVVFCVSGLCSVSLFLLVSTSAINCVEGLISEVTCYVSSGTLNPTHSLSKVWAEIGQTDIRTQTHRQMQKCIVLPRSRLVTKKHWHRQQLTSYVFAVFIICIT